jgi:phage tail-like protein
MKRNAIELLLPEILRRTVRPENPLEAILQTMEDLHAPSIEILGHLDSYLDPYRTPDPFVAYLARWLDLERLFDDPTDDYTAPEDGRNPISSGLGRLRELIASAAYLSQWRGTRQGLLRFLQVATGFAEFAIDEQVPGKNGELLPFHIRVRAPRGARIHRTLVERIITLEKPAYVTYELDFGS